MSQTIQISISEADRAAIAEEVVSRMPKPEADEWLTLDETAAFLKLSTKTVSKYAFDLGIIPVHGIAGEVRFLRSEVNGALKTIEPKKSRS